MEKKNLISIYNIFCQVHFTFFFQKLLASDPRNPWVNMLRELSFFYQKEGRLFVEGTRLLLGRLLVKMIALLNNLQNAESANKAGIFLPSSCYTSRHDENITSH